MARRRWRGMRGCIRIGCCEVVAARKDFDANYVGEAKNLIE